MDNTAAAAIAEALTENNTLQRVYLGGNMRVDKRHKRELVKKFQGERLDLQLHSEFSGVKECFGGTIPQRDSRARIANLDVI